MEIREYEIPHDPEVNVILGMSHFIKTVDDIAEIINTTNPQAKYAVAFCEASGPALIRYEGNDQDLTKKAIDIMQNIKAGHSFIILLKNAYPINILTKIKLCDEVVRVFCASSNPLTVLIATNQRGSGIVGVIDGESPKGVENDDDKTKRREFLRKIKYKF